MILIETPIGEPALPVAVESIRAQVLVCLRAHHHIHTFATAAALEADLDVLLAELRGVDPTVTGLTRVILFYRDLRVTQVVADRMMPGGSCQVFQMPGCWWKLGKNLSELRAWAERIEPGWMAAMQGR